MTGSDGFTAPPPHYKRLEEATRPLEAQYAVLSEANARSAAVQSMLRDSQPLLWLDNALVLQRRKEQSGFQSRNNRRGLEVIQIDDVDELELLMESDLRRRQRMKWEVAKRVARVEREISKLPTAQRSWHVKERKRLEEGEARRRREEERRRDQEKKEGEKNVRLRREREKRRAQKSGLSDQHAFSRRPVKPELKLVDMPPPTKEERKQPSRVDMDLDLGSPMRNSKFLPSLEKTTELAATSENKENILPPPPSVDSQAHDAASVSFEQIARQPLHRFPGLPLNADDNVTDERAKITDLQSAPPLQHEAASGNNRPTASSLGRQVLSDYRTVPTAVSFGPPPVMGSLTDRKLNGDVVRRLFNDLDTDRDGFLNRIETSMALHRLHLNVPAQRIIAFFKRIHCSEEFLPRGSIRSRSKATSRSALNELISFRQFAAFVCTAFDQHKPHDQANKILAESSQTDNSHMNQDPSQPQIVTLLSSPCLTSSPPPGHQCSGAVSDEENQGLRLVEQRREEDMTARILAQIPECLTMQVLSETEQPADMQQIVRRSLEKIESDVDNTVVERVTRELVERYTNQLLLTHDPRHRQPDGHDRDDFSGLKRAGSFFESLGDRDNSLSPREQVEQSVTEWWSALTDEQVGALVQEIWRTRESEVVTPPIIEKSPSLSGDGVVAVEETKKDNYIEIKIPLDSETAPKRQVLRVVEKAIQTRSFEWISPAQASQTPPPPPSPPLPLLSMPPSGPMEAIRSPHPPPESSAPQPLPSTTLARVILASGKPSLNSTSNQHQVNSKHDRTTAVLTELRRQRLRRQATALTPRSTQSNKSAESYASGESKISLRADASTSQFLGLPPDTANVSPLPDEVSSSPTDPIESTPIREFHQRTTPGQTIPNRISCNFSASIPSDDSSNSYSSSLTTSINFFREFEDEDTWRHASRRRCERLGRRTRHRRGRVISDSADVGASRGSNDEENLSEGEIWRATDLSDGEMYGLTRRKVVRAKNERIVNGVLREAVQSEKTSSSLEAGEMLPSLVTLHHSYRERVLKMSMSSLESGEA